MKYKYTFLAIFFGSLFVFSDAFAAGQKQGETTKAETTQHPPHDHHHTDHIKKLDEGLRRRRLKKFY